MEHLNDSLVPPEACIKLAIEKLKPDFPCGAAVLSFIECLARLQAAGNADRAPGDYSGITIEYNNGSPQDVLDNIALWTNKESSPEEIAQWIAIPQADRFITFRWFYSVRDETIPSGYRGYGISDGRLLSRKHEGALVVHANMGEISDEMPLDETLGQIDYPIIATEHAANRRYEGPYAYANAAYTRKALQSEQ